MSFYEQLGQWSGLQFSDIWERKTLRDVEQALARKELSEEDFLSLLSPAARPMTEAAAKRAEEDAAARRGKTMALFAPLYLSDYCTNHCVYCSFSRTVDFPRKKLALEEIVAEGRQIADNGIRHILLLTGDAPRETPVSYLKESVEALLGSFETVGIEVNALSAEDYGLLAKAGVTGMTMYQEVYNEAIYKALHPKGPKRNFRYRLDAPERSCQGGMKAVTIGALLGLDEWRKEVFLTGMHARYLKERYPGTAVSLSVPRMRPFAGSYQPASIVEDGDLIQAITALRLFLPDCGFTISTREPAHLRDRLIQLGVVKMSAGVSTQVGGYSAAAEESTKQFEISDGRTVDEVRSMLMSRGYTVV